MAPSLTATYLLLYNSACCIGWAWILALSVPSVFSTIISSPLEIGNVLASVYNIDGVAKTLIMVQSAALLEIVHACVGFVRSPIIVTAMQVGSRIVALYAITHSPESQVQFGAGLMILSWSMVEVPRYLFYVFALITGDATKKTPFIVFWLRYSLFGVLYPTGITGELTVFLAAAKDPVFLNAYGEQFASLMYYYIMFFPVIYIPGSPVMILNMIANRKNAFKKRFARPPPPPRGLVFPQTPKGDRPSTPIGKLIISAAIRAVNPDMAQKVLKERNWRFGYVKHWINMVDEQCKSPEAALAVAEAGLKEAYEVFEFVDSNGKSSTFKEAMAAKSSDKFYTGHVKGQASSAKKQLEIPYKGKILSGDALKQQVDKWVEYGTIEPSAGEAIKGCVDNPGWMDLSNRHFVLLGAGSAMGPFLVLMALGANVIAIDLDRPQIWKRLLNIAKNSPGSMTFPMKVEQTSCTNDEELHAASGCNLFTQTPQIRDWLIDLYPGEQFVVGSYAYLNGALHVQVSLAMDAICRDLSEKRKASLAYLCTPTDLHLVTKEAHEASLEHYKVYSKKLFCIIISMFSRGKCLRKNARRPTSTEGGEFYTVNGISVAQGPNYALAKRMQHWRAIIARSKGSIVSSNIAPATSTVSVTQNRTFAWAYEGMPYFKPYEISAPETSNAVMSAILFSDLNDPKSAGNPQTKLDNPNEIFKYGSFNGGCWRCAYEVDSIGEASVLIYFFRQAKPYIGIAAALAAAISAKAFGFL
uniref:very-long-chain (3R)-3-hydroxyacyl-CoA dehydratase n=1 Tax=Eucampia antarctica TaxID=49252 RepID=A0A7S2SAM4_9STRA|mmetsp:Transcript_5510/g.5149  ORF Transcript_5510/g.5149 Transcript_5510/m.5149 type:complete len:754 (+) Transcript_5510:74-2335(+)